MANIRKQFNFRNGVQVDDDNLVVSPTGLVGIGTTIPTEALDVRGTAKVVGLVTASQIFTPDLTATNISINSLELGNSIIGGGVSIRSGVITASGSGVVTYYGDGGRLLNLPTSQWLDADVGLGFTSVYAQGFVGISTNDPRYPLQIGGSNNLSAFVDGVGINSNGNIVATGIVTGAKFVGIGSDLTQLNASSIAYGVISNDRIPVLLNSKMPSNISVSGVITATGGFIGTVAGNIFGNLSGNVTGDLTGNVTGIASTARSLTGNPDIVVNNVTATSIAVTSITNATSIGATNINLTGIATARTIHVGTGGTAVSITSDGRIGIGSALPTQAIQIVKEDIAAVEVVGSEARLVLSQERSGVSVGSSAGVIRYGNSDKSFELLNQALGDFNLYLHTGEVGVNTGRFNWIYGQDFTQLMSLTYEGDLGIGLTNPANTLHVVGTSTVTSNSYVGGDLTVYGALNIQGTIQLPSLIQDSNINVTTGISTFNNIESYGYISAGSSIGIGTDGPLVGLDARTSDQLINRIGVGFTDYNGEQTIDAALHVYGDSILDGNVGIGTTNALTNLSGPEDPSSTFYERLQSGREALLKVYDGVVEVENGELGLVNTPFITDELTRIGVGTANPRSAVDFSRAGYLIPGKIASFLIMPRVTSAERVGLQTVEGAVIFNTDTKTFQGYTGIGWSDFH